MRNGQHASTSHLVVRPCPVSVLLPLYRLGGDGSVYFRYQIGIQVLLSVRQLGGVPFKCAA